MIQASPDCCEEASPLSGAAYLPCNLPATKVGWRGRADKPIRMCAACADHNVRNRGGYVVSDYPALPPSTGTTAGQLLSARERGAQAFRERLGREGASLGGSRTADHVTGFKVGWDMAIEHLRHMGKI